MLSGANAGGCPAPLLGKMIDSGCLSRKAGDSSCAYVEKNTVDISRLRLPLTDGKRKKEKDNG